MTLVKSRFPHPEVTRSSIRLEELEKAKNAAELRVEMLQDQDRRHREELDRLLIEQLKAPSYRIASHHEALRKGSGMGLLVYYTDPVEAEDLEAARRDATEAEKAYSKALRAHERLAAGHETIDVEQACAAAGTRYYANHRHLKIAGLDLVAGEPISIEALASIPEAKREALLRSRRIGKVFA